jgi:hypothetical protein
VKVTIELDCVDFEQLTVNSMQWHGLGWHDQPYRFSPAYGDDINWGLARAYWFADAASMILARSYLSGRGERYQVLWDETGDGTPYVIVTNYIIRRK